MIIQECEDPGKSKDTFQHWAGNFLWIGENKNKGIGIFDRAGIGLEALPWKSDGLQSFLPCRVGNAFTLVAVWTKYANSPNFRYIGQLWKYLQMHKHSMAAIPVALIGDLNSNSCWDEWDRWWNQSDVVRELQEIGVTSIYHRFFQEAQGSESRPTLYHRRKVEKPYHVDYAFCTESLFSPTSGSVDVGKPDDWLKYSDHMPLVFSIDR